MYPPAKDFQYWFGHSLRKSDPAIPSVVSEPERNQESPSRS
jgi:hypothetical protein